MLVLWAPGESETENVSLLPAASAVNSWQPFHRRSVPRRAFVLCRGCFRALNIEAASLSLDKKAVKTAVNEDPTLALLNDPKPALNRWDRYG